MNCERDSSTNVCRSHQKLSARLFLWTGLIALAAALCSTPALAQVESGTISGTVRDASGAVVAGATVTARNAATSAERTVQTGENGQYNLPGLAPGVYQITVASTGFATFKAR